MLFFKMPETLHVANRCRFCLSYLVASKRRRFFLAVMFKQILNMQISVKAILVELCRKSLNSVQTSTQSDSQIYLSLKTPHWIWLMHENNSLLEVYTVSFGLETINTLYTGIC